MRYVIAISKCLEGCVALKVQPGRELVALKKEIYRKVGYESIELVTISRPSIYGEYVPYRFVETMEEFKLAAYQLLLTKSQISLTDRQIGAYMVTRNCILKVL